VRPLLRPHRPPPPPPPPPYTRTHAQGPGTQIRRGIKIHQFGSFGGVDVTRLQQLFRGAGAAGERTLALLASGAPLGGGSVAAVFVADNYSGAAIVVSPAAATPAASPVKIIHGMALSPLAYAEGTEAALWSEVLRAFPAVSWLAPPCAPIASAASDIQKLGAAAIPATFPPLSAERSALHADGQQRLTGLAATAMWTGVSLEQAPGVVAALRLSAGLDPAPAPPAPKPIVFPSGSSSAGAKATRVGLLGARGYTGRELVRLFARHPDFQVWGVIEYLPA
jgi:hypothetical protein